MIGTVTDRATELAPLLREYAEKMTDLNRELLAALGQRHPALTNSPEHVAWLLDRAKRFDRPMRELVNQATRAAELSAISFGDESQSVENAEMLLRLGETEAQLHHMLRLAWELQKRVEDAKASEAVARLRESAGLNGMKGGPLRPNG